MYQRGYKNPPSLGAVINSIYLYITLCTLDLVFFYIDGEAPSLIPSSSKQLEDLSEGDIVVTRDERGKRRSLLNIYLCSSYENKKLKIKSKSKKQKQEKAKAKSKTKQKATEQQAKRKLIKEKRKLVEIMQT